MGSVISLQMKTQLKIIMYKQKINNYNYFKGV